MKDSILTKSKSYLFTSLGIVLIFIFWLVLSLIIDNEIILPSVSRVVSTLFGILKLSSTYKIILFTIIRIVISLLFGVLFGVIFGILSYLFNPIYLILSPIIKIMRALPIASIILIIFIMFGSKGFNDLTFSPILVNILLVIPIVYEAVFKGLKAINKDYIDVARLETNSNYSLIVNSYMPLIKNEFEISISQSIGLSFKAMVMAEYITQTKTSIGFELVNAKSWLEYDKVFSWTIILILLSVLLEAIGKLIVKNKD